jgi:hypothetical protein
LVTIVHDFDLFIDWLQQKKNAYRERNDGYG